MDRERLITRLEAAGWMVDRKFGIAECYILERQPGYPNILIRRDQVYSVGGAFRLKVSLDAADDLFESYGIPPERLHENAKKDWEAFAELIREGKICLSANADSKNCSPSRP